MEILYPPQSHLLDPIAITSVLLLFAFWSNFASSGREERRIFASRAKGRRENTFSCAFFILTVEINSIARVIFTVFLTDLMRDLISFGDAIIIQNEVPIDQV